MRTRRRLAAMFARQPGDMRIEPPAEMQCAFGDRGARQRLGGQARRRDHVDAVHRACGTQSSHPLQSAAMTVCMRLRAPTMASVGQGSMQRAQPMQAGSSIQATAARPPARRMRRGACRAVEQRRELVDQRGSARAGSD
jgi:hypothetical protein